MKNFKNLKRGLIIKDTRREIQGILINILNKNKESLKIHVEYKRFKDDTDPFVIEYDKTEIKKDLYFIKENKNKKHYYLTVGKLKRSLNKSKISDDSIICIESNEKYKKNDSFVKTKDILNKKTGLPIDFGSIFRKSWGTGYDNKKGNFFIYYNY